MGGQEGKGITDQNFFKKDLRIIVGKNMTRAAERQFLQCKKAWEIFQLFFQLIQTVTVTSNKCLSSLFLKTSHDGGSTHASYHLCWYCITPGSLSKLFWVWPQGNTNYGFGWVLIRKGLKKQVKTLTTPFILVMFKKVRLCQWGKLTIILPSDLTCVVLNFGEETSWKKEKLY